MEVYFDNAATTKPRKEVIEVVAKTMQENYGNPSSAHMKGVFAEEVIVKARRTLSEAIKSKPDEVFFTSGGTEGNNTIIFGVADSYKRVGNKIIISRIEHPSVANLKEELVSRGFEVIDAPLDDNGVVITDELVKLIDENVILVSIMYVNNEIGIIQPLRDIVKAVKKANPKTLVHSDCVQAFGKIEIDVRELGVDCITISSHKIHGPKGVGAIYKKKGVKIKPLLMGSSQQLGARAGTENVYGIAGFAKAIEMIMEGRKKFSQKVSELKKDLVQKLIGIEEVFFFVDNDVCVDYIISFGIKNIKSEVMLHSLESSGIYVSNGAACSSKNKAKKGTLLGIGVPFKEAETAIRVSFNGENTSEEIDYFVDNLIVNIEKLRRFVKR